MSPYNTFQRHLYWLEAMWVKAICYEDTITAEWKHNGESSSLLNMIDTIQDCGNKITHWSSSCLGNIKQKLTVKRRKLPSFQEGQSTLHSSSIELLGMVLIYFWNKKS